MEDKIELPKTIIPLILIGDVRKVLKKLPEGGVNCIITSPPYYGQRDYGVKNQIGIEKDHKEYIKNMLEVADLLKDCLSDDGCYFLNIGDKYNDKGLKMIPFELAIKMQENGWILRNIIVWHKPNHMPSSISDRFNTTWEPIFFFVKDTGKYYPREYYSNIDDIRVGHRTENEEDIGLPLVLTKEEFESKKNLSLPHKESTYQGKFLKVESRKNLGASPGARASLLKVNGNKYKDVYSEQRKHKISNELEIEIIKYLREARNKKEIGAKDIDKKLGYKDTAGHWFRLDMGRSLPKPEDWIKLKQILNFDDKYDKIMTEIHYVLQTFKKNPKGKIPSDVWFMPTGKLKEEHFAVFPEDLPRTIIKAFCPLDGIVLDPFAGSGTTMKIAKELRRKSIGVELNEEYLEIIKKRCGGISLV